MARLEWARRVVRRARRLGGRLSEMAGSKGDELMFALDWRLGANPLSARRFASGRPALSEVQRRVANDLEEVGFSTVPFRDLFGIEGQSRYEELEKMALAFAESDDVRSAAARYQSDFGLDRWKQYVVKRFKEPGAVSLNDPLLQLALTREILDTVNSYFGLFASLFSIDLWYTVALPFERKRNASQNWHRDPEDRRTCKVFVYFTDVGDAAGPLEYIPESRVGREYAHLCPPTRGGRRGFGYPDQQLIESTVPKERHVAGVGPAGTMVFCDTSGLHRGGYAVAAGRLLAVLTYLTPASRYTREPLFWLDASRQSPSLGRTEHEAIRKAMRRTSNG